MHVHEPLPIKMLLDMQVPEPITQVIKKMTEKDPDARYQSMDALTIALAVSNLPLPRVYRDRMYELFPGYHP